MIRKLLLPAIAASLLAGCVVGDYAYRDGGRGDYYYGQPTTEYRYYDSYGGGYYPYGAPYRYGYGPRYGIPYGYGSPYGYYGNSFGFFGSYYGRPGYRPQHRPRPNWGGHPGNDNGGDHGNDGNRPPWRDFNQLRRRPAVGGGGGAPTTVPAPPTAAPGPGRSPMQQAIREGVRHRTREAAEQQQP